MKNKTNGWTEEEFEDQIVRGIVCCYETKIKKEKGAFPSDRLNEAMLQKVRDYGIWFYSRNTELIPETDQILPMDIRNAAAMCIGEKKETSLKFGGYCNNIFIGKYEKILPKHWKRTGGGDLFQLLYVSGNEKGVSGTRKFLSIDKQGNIYPCFLELGSTGRVDRLGISSGAVIDDSDSEEIATNASFTMQFCANSDYGWLITARENAAKVVFSCDSEEVKSLLYARSAPLSSTGRKRPILHLVAAHRRRLKNGTDIDIEEFKRGVHVVEMNGTTFEVRAPINDAESRYKKMLKRYEESQKK